MGNAAADMKEYRDGYPEKALNNKRMNLNARFYANEVPSTPDGDLIENIHKKWRGQYGWLERHHGYIQWLFPIHEKGMNYESQVLQRHEKETIRKDPVMKARVVASYELMLDFYGLKLTDREKGTVEREDNWVDRFHNLNTSGHNYLRITRILKCLGEMELEHYKRPLLERFIQEVYVTKKLNRAASSCRDYWVPTLKDDKDRAELLAAIDKLQGRASASSHGSGSDEDGGGPDGARGASGGGGAAGSSDGAARRAKWDAMAAGDGDGSGASAAAAASSGAGAGGGAGASAAVGATTTRAGSDVRMEEDSDDTDVDDAVVPDDQGAAATATTAAAVTTDGGDAESPQQPPAEDTSNNNNTDNGTSVPK